MVIDQIVSATQFLQSAAQNSLLTSKDLSITCLSACDKKKEKCQKVGRLFPAKPPSSFVCPFKEKFHIVQVSSVF